MPSFEIDFSVYCAKCGEGLCNLSNAEQDTKDNRVYVGPCPHCMEEAKAEGYQEGYETPR